jgi:hypothetical protein
MWLLNVPHGAWLGRMIVSVIGFGNDGASARGD